MRLFITATATINKITTTNTTTNNGNGNNNSGNNNIKNNENINNNICKTQSSSIDKSSSVKILNVLNIYIYIYI